MQPKLQGAVILCLGVVVLLAGGMGSIVLLTGAATGSSFPHVLTVFGLALTIIGWVGYKELRADFNPVPWAAGIMVVSILAVGIMSRI